MDDKTHSIRERIFTLSEKGNFVCCGRRECEKITKFMILLCTVRGEKFFLRESFVETARCVLSLVTCIAFSAMFFLISKNHPILREMDRIKLSFFANAGFNGIRTAWIQKSIFNVDELIWGHSRGSDEKCPTIDAEKACLNLHPGWSF